jgi:hypothetical protein
MIHDPQHESEPRTARSRSARTALLDALRKSPGNEGGHFDPLTQPEFDSLIKTVPPLWKPTYQGAFEVAMIFEADGKSGRIYWNLACELLQRFRQTQEVIQYSLQDNDRLYEIALARLSDTLEATFDAIAILYRNAILTGMRKSYSPPQERTRKAIPKATIEQLARTLAKTPFSQKGELIQSVADEYEVTKRTIYRRLDALNRQP